MSTNALIKKYFTYAYLNIAYEYKACTVHTLFTKDGKIKSSEDKRFKSYDNSMPMDAINYVDKMTSKYRFSYVTVLNESVSQSIMEMCEKDGIHEDGDYVWVCVERTWGAVSKQEDIDEIQEKHDRIGGVDFIFSPYIVLWRLIKEREKDEKKMYILNIKSSVALVVADTKNVEYGAFFAMLTNEMQSIEEIPDEIESDGDSVKDEMSDDFEIEGEEESQNTEESQKVGEEHELDELDGLESLDEATGLEEFDEGSSEKDASEKKEGETIVDENAKKEDKFDEAQHEESFEEFARGVEIINQIKETLNDYYKNPNMSSDFIDKITIFDNTGLSEETINYMSDVLLLDIDKQEIDIGATVNKLSKDEIDGNL